MVVVGEIHDNPHHHANQARAVASLGPGALVFEQLTPRLAARITPELLGDAKALEAALEWEERGWPSFSMYYPIFAAAPDAAIFGGGLPNEDVRRAMSEGAASVFGGGASIFELDRSYSDELQADMEALQQAAHCDAMPPELLPGMVEAQRLRDAALARATLAAYEESVARKGRGMVVVITGNGHARRDLGVPSLLPKGLSVRSVGQFEEFAPDSPTFDDWIVTRAIERDDPCDAFR